MTGILSLADLAERLADADSDSAATLLRIDPARSRPFAPFVGYDLDQLHPKPDLSLLAGASDYILSERQRRYALRVAARWSGPRLVASGDSWFNFPPVRDLVQQLDEDHAVLCLSGDGGLLHNLISQQQLCDAVVEHRPDAVLVSAGGGDLLAAHRLPAFLHSSRPKWTASDHLTSYFSQFLVMELIPRLRGLLQALVAVDGRVPIVLHSYAHAIPRNFIWLGQPLASRGIHDHGLQRQIVALIVDQYHNAVSSLISQPEFSTVHLVDCRTAIGAHWFDELHPNHRGFELVAQCFRQKLESIWH